MPIDWKDMREATLWIYRRYSNAGKMANAVAQLEHVETYEQALEPLLEITAHLLTEVMDGRILLSEEHEALSGDHADIKQRVDKIIRFMEQKDQSRSVVAAVRSVKHIQRIKRLVERTLVRGHQDTNAVLEKPYLQFGYNKVIIRPIENDTYPEFEEALDAVMTWSRAELFDLYHAGIEFIVDIVSIFIRDDMSWAIVPYDESAPHKRLHKVQAWKIGCLPYQNIVEIDTSGDEFYSHPQIFCQFPEPGNPFTEFRYRLRPDGRYPQQLLEEDRMEREELVKL